jgi:hypothetical protein
VTEARARENVRSILFASFAMNKTPTSFNRSRSGQKIIREISHELKVASAAKVWIDLTPRPRAAVATPVAEKPLENKRFHPLPPGSMVTASHPSVPHRSAG